MNDRKITERDIRRGYFEVMIVFQFYDRYTRRMIDLWALRIKLEERDSRWKGCNTVMRNGAKSVRGTTSARRPHL